MADVRSLLRNERASRRIKHPQAAYSPTGALQCQICKVQLKSETLWDTHLRSADHAARFQRLRQEISATSRRSSRAVSTSEAPSSKKRKLAGDDEDGRKRAKPTFGLPESFFDGREVSEEPEGERDETVQSPVEKEPPRPIKLPKSTSAKVLAQAQPHGLPSDFFAPSSSTLSTVPTRPSAPLAPTDLSRSLDDELAAFERDIAATVATSPILPPRPATHRAWPSALTASATIVAEPLTAVELAARSRVEASTQAKEKREEEMEGEKEDAQARLEEEFEEMEGLEERVRRLKGRREAILRGLQVGMDETGGGAGAEDESPEGQEEAVDDDDDDDDDEGNEWDGWGFR